MSDIAIKIENISKLYQLGTVSTQTLYGDLHRWWARLRGQEDPFQKIGAANSLNSKDGEFVWALKDVNLEIKQGDIVGIIGRNGAGKSTLLKLLSRVTAPTTGQITVNGRIASLLEVGTGFHPELTGRENVFLNGAIMGMTKAEIRSKFDEIVDFSGVEKYIDTPVKRYSSGMYVRLAFAVAAHLEPEILIVDEVLAVGDADFQKKCLGKMGDVAKNGRTVLFVSHNMGAVEALCNSGVLMQHGQVKFIGTASQTIENYISSDSENSSFYRNNNPREDSDILSIDVLNTDNKPTANFQFDEEIKIKFQIQVAEKHSSASLGVRIKDQRERNVFTTQISIKEIISKSGLQTIEVTIPNKFLVPNNYTLIVGFHVPNQEVIRILETVSFTIEETGTDFYQYAGNDYGCVFVDCKWKAI